MGFGTFLLKLPRTWTAGWELVQVDVTSKNLFKLDFKWFSKHTCDLIREVFNLFLSSCIMETASSGVCAVTFTSLFTYFSPFQP